MALQYPQHKLVVAEISTDQESAASVTASFSAAAAPAVHAYLDAFEAGAIGEDPLYVEYLWKRCSASTWG